MESHKEQSGNQIATDKKAESSRTLADAKKRISSEHNKS